MTESELYVLEPTTVDLDNLIGYRVTEHVQVTFAGFLEANKHTL